jgi:hypothetical protein
MLLLLARQFYERFPVSDRRRGIGDIIGSARFHERIRIDHRAKTETFQGFNIRRWSERGLNYWAVSDLGADELTEFGEKFEVAMRSSGTG